MDDQGTRLLVKIAQLYHGQGLNQDRISRQLGISRSKVSRMLKEARERGLVEVSIHYPSRFSLDLERQLEAQFGLREAVVVSASGLEVGQALNSVAAAAAEYLLRVLRSGAVLGVSGGEAVTLAAQAMPAGTIERVSVVQLGSALADLGEGAAFTSAEVALHLARKLGSMDRLVLVPIPSLLDTETIRDALLRDSGVRQAMALMANCTMALVGIGTLNTVSRAPVALISPEDAEATWPHAQPSRRCRQRLPPVTEDEVVELRTAGAVGEICARFFNIEGQPCATSLDRRMLAPDLSELWSIPLVIGVASGRQKAAAILGAVRGGYVKSLVTDDITAVEVLALAGSVTTGALGHEGGHQTSDTGRLGRAHCQHSERTHTNNLTADAQ